MYAILNIDGSVKATFIRAQPHLHEVVEIADNDPRLVEFRLGNNIDAFMKRVYTLCNNLRQTILGNELNTILLRAAARSDNPRFAPWTKQGQAMVGAEIDIAYSYNKFAQAAGKTTKTANAAAAALQSDLDAIADTCSVAHVVLGELK